MLDSQYLAKILLLASFLSFSAFSDTRSNSFKTFSYQNLSLANQVISYRKFNNKHILINQTRTAKVKFGMVFTPEDLSTVPYKNFLTRNDATQLIANENSDRIIGFYIQSFL